MISNITTFIVAGKFCSQGTERSCWCRQLCASESSLHCPSWRKETLKPDYFNILIQKFDLPCFHQLVTGFHGNGNGISISCFRFSAVPCQLRAVNAIWLTARIQNSSILKWQGEGERKGLPSPCTSLSLRIIPLYDRLSHWLMTIRHTPSLRCPSWGISPDPLPPFTLQLQWHGWSSWLPTCCAWGGQRTWGWSKRWKETV